MESGREKMIKEKGRIAKYVQYNILHRVFRCRK